MNVKTLVKNKKLVCPISGKPLEFDDNCNFLVTENGQYRYKMLNGEIPVLLAEEKATEDYVSSGATMTKIIDRMVTTEKENETPLTGYEKARRKVRAWLKNSFWARLKKKGYLSDKAFEWNEKFKNGFKEDDLRLYIGGGPDVFQGCLNVNIAPYPMVDIVADAHNVPFSTNSVDFVYNQAVIEHLYDPQKAVEEMFRCLKPGGLAFVVTPFLQEYHGYPHHYCNFTITGNKKLFENAGFEMLDYGTWEGPAQTIYALNLRFLTNYAPWYVRIPVKILFRPIGLLALKPMDKRILNDFDSHILASSTYVVAKKPV